MIEKTNCKFCGTSIKVPYHCKEDNCTCLGLPLKDKICDKVECFNAKQQEIENNVQWAGAALEHKSIMEKDNILILVNRNASGYFWYLQKNDTGTSLGEMFDGNRHYEFYVTYIQALENAIGLIKTCGLKQYREETNKGHWGNYAGHLNKINKK